MCKDMRWIGGAIGEWLESTGRIPMRFCRDIRRLRHGLAGRFRTHWFWRAFWADALGGCASGLIAGAVAAIVAALVVGTYVERLFEERLSQAASLKVWVEAKPVQESSLELYWALQNTG